MNNRTVIGLNLTFFMRALIATVLSFIAMLLPFTGKESGGKNMISTVFSVLSAENSAGISFFLYLAVLFTTASLIVGIASYLKTSVKIVKAWMYVQVCATFFWTMLLFATKIILENSGIEENFLLKNAGIGFWLGILTAYVSLVFIMRVAEKNVGYIVLSILGVIWMFPVLWILLTALRAEQGYYVGYFFPKHLTLKNFYDLFHNSAVPFGKWWLNTMIVAICGCVLNTLIVLGTAFVLSRTRFSGRKPFMNILMIIGMFPGFMSMVALYNILKGLGINQSIGALIVVGAAGAAMGYHITKGYFDTIPKAIDEAAIIDGASRLQIFTRITIPLSKSIIVYQVLGTFLGAWSDYIFPRLLFGDRQSSYTVAVGLFWMTDFRRIDSYYTQFAAGAVVIAVPIVILFIWLQRFYVEGLSGSVKG
ncbi:sugar ABC transporter permease [Butyrivibrio sp. YAB3001]|uniref:sugar ABC transporter permease n=1 Tax=Butyrivibrio sp. YAB3001 TaxID=1520812 RepID=UPI0008F63A63|nr:ABC transporter permease subunit [Butyrivibrio sp. YAB3001]SFC81769.1 arabinogalactan oligomer / maltooligosaccharide transport system permease protein [Butyrivibrio sp. YAB3001]